MAQNEISKSSSFNPTSDNCRGYGFLSDGTPVIIEEDGTPKAIGIVGDGAAPDNVIANSGVGLDADKPAFNTGVVYVANDTNKVYTGTGSGTFTDADLVSGQFVTDTSQDPYVYYQFNGFQLNIISTGGGDSPWNVQRVSSNVAEASPYIYYKANGTNGPFTIYLPDVVSGNKDEFSVELEVDTHKVTVSTVGGVQLFDQSGISRIIPGVSTRMVFKANGVDGYNVICDGRLMPTEVTITESRDFTTDGYEHKTTYKIKPTDPLTPVILTLPTPKTYDNMKGIEARFLLKSEGSCSIIRIDSGNIGNDTELNITTVDSGVTLLESQSEYSIVQDSRSKLVSNFSFPFYRLDDISTVEDPSNTGVFFRELARNTDDPRYGSEVLTLTPLIASTTAINYVSYITDTSPALNDFPAGSFEFFATTRKVMNAGSDVYAYYTISKLLSNNTETQIAQSPPFIIASTAFDSKGVKVQYPEITIEVGTSLVMRTWVGRTGTGGQDPQLETKIEGFDGAFFQNTIPSTSLRHNDIDGRSADNAHPDSSITNTSTNFSQDTVKEIHNDAQTPTEQTTLADTDIIFTATPVSGSEVSAKYISYANFKGLFTAIFNTLFAGKSSNDLSHSNNDAETTTTGAAIRLNELALDGIGSAVSQNSGDIADLKSDEPTYVIEDVDEDWAADKTANPSKYQIFPSGYELIKVTAVRKSGNVAQFVFNYDNQVLAYHNASSEKTYYIWEKGYEKTNVSSTMDSDSILGFTNVFFANTSGTTQSFSFGEGQGGWNSTVFDVYFTFKKLITV